MDTDRLLLIVEDDEAFARTLARSFERRGYQVLHAEGIARMEELLAVHTPQYAVVDLKLKGEANGLACVRALHAHSPQMRIVVLTGFASIATAVEAIKLGAGHYLAKPSNTDDIEAAFALQEGNTEVELTNRSSSIKTLEWERIHEVLAESDFNISEAALALAPKHLFAQLDERVVDDALANLIDEANNEALVVDRRERRTEHFVGLE